MGQTEKNPVRAHIFRFAPEPGHRSTSEHVGEKWTGLICFSTYACGIDRGIRVSVFGPRPADKARRIKRAVRLTAAAVSSGKDNATNRFAVTQTSENPLTSLVYEYPVPMQLMPGTIVYDPRLPTCRTLTLNSRLHSRWG
jgi:hypothetical protein